MPRYKSTASTILPTCDAGAAQTQATLAPVVLDGEAANYDSLAWTLTRVTTAGASSDRTADLDDATILAPTFTPIALGDVYTATLTATNADGSDTDSVVVQVQPAAELAWEEVFDLDFTAAGNVAAPSTDGEDIEIAGVTFGTDNGVARIANVAGTGLVFTPTSSLAQVLTGQSMRTALILTATFATLGIADVFSEDVVMLLQVEAFAPASNSGLFLFGVEDPTVPYGTGAADAGYVFGWGKNTTQRFQEEITDQSGVVALSPNATYDTSSDRVCGVRLTQGLGTAAYHAVSTAAMDAADPVASLTSYSAGGARWRGVPPSALRMLLAVETGSLGSPAALTVQRLRVLRRVAALASA